MKNLSAAIALTMKNLRAGSSLLIQHKCVRSCLQRNFESKIRLIHPQKINTNYSVIIISSDQDYAKQLEKF